MKITCCNTSLNIQATEHASFTCKEIYAGRVEYFRLRNYRHTIHTKQVFKPLPEENLLLLTAMKNTCPNSGIRRKCEMAIKKLQGFDPDTDLQFTEDEFWQDEEGQTSGRKEELQSGQLAWKFRIGGPILGGIQSIIDPNGNRRIYLGTTERNLHAIETDSDGFDPKMVWQESLNGDIISTPLFKDYVIYLVTKAGGILAIDSGLHGKKYTPGKAINIKPTIIWDTKLRKGINTEPFLSSNMLMVASWDDHLHAYEASYNNPESYQIGKELWSFRAEGINSSPNLFEGTVYIGDDEGTLYAVNYGGKTAETFWKVACGGGIWTRPYVDEQFVFTTTLDGYIVCVDSSQGKVAWKFKTGDKMYSSPLVIPVEGGRKACVAGSDDGILYAVYHTGGSANPLWKIKTKGKVRAEPIIHHGKILVGSGDNNFYCIEAQSGTILWRYTTDGNIYSKAAILGDKVIFGSSDGFLYSVKI